MATSDQKRLQRFSKEVLFRGPRACLPSSLDAYWLRELGRQGDALLVGGGDGHTVELLAVVLALLSHQRGGGEISVSEAELHEYVMRYALEISFESITRRTDMKVDAATLDTILTERDVRVDMSALAAAGVVPPPAPKRTAHRRGRRPRKA